MPCTSIMHTSKRAMRRKRVRFFYFFVSRREHFKRRCSHSLERIWIEKKREAFHHRSTQSALHAGRPSVIYHSDHQSLHPPPAINLDRPGTFAQFYPLHDPAEQLPDSNVTPDPASVTWKGKEAINGRTRNIGFSGIFGN